MSEVFSIRITSAIRHRTSQRDGAKPATFMSKGKRLLRRSARAGQQIPGLVRETRETYRRSAAPTQQAASLATLFERSSWVARFR